MRYCHELKAHSSWLVIIELISFFQLFQFRQMSPCEQHAPSSNSILGLPFERDVVGKGIKLLVDENIGLSSSLVASIDSSFFFFIPSVASYPVSPPISQPWTWS